MSDYDIRETYLKEAIRILSRLYYRLPDTGSKAEVLSARRNIVSAMNYRDVLMPDVISDLPKVHRTHTNYREKTCFYEANGERKHIAEWARLLQYSQSSVRNYLSEGITMQELFDKVNAPGYRKYGRGHKPKANHEWIKQARIKNSQAEDRKKKEGK